MASFCPNSKHVGYWNCSFCGYRIFHSIQTSKEKLFDGNGKVFQTLKNSWFNSQPSVGEIIHNDAIKRILMANAPSQDLSSTNQGYKISCSQCETPLGQEFFSKTENPSKRPRYKFYKGSISYIPNKP